MIGRRITSAAGIFAAGLVLIAAPACSQQSDTFVEVDPSDARMNAAIAEAKASLPQFWSRYNLREPGYSEFMVKAGMAAKGEQGFEHIWMDVVDYRGGKVIGRLANEPVHLQDLKFGSEVSVAPEIISDWGYSKGDVIYGHFTTRVMMTTQDPEASLADYGLSQTPLESETN